MRATMSTAARLLDRRKKPKVRKVGCLHPLIWNGIMRGWKGREKEQKGLHRIKKLRPEAPRTVGRQLLQHLEVESGEIKGVVQSWR